ncbi:hypothetical protein KAH43_02340 [Candidatus Bipolaricaulota bacterium]|nr:hypothetical protein [Candidatus Bipolaricaulota bacterium]
MPDDAPPELQEQVTAYIKRMNREFRKDRNVKRAWNEIPNVKVVVYEDTSYYCFLDKEREVIESVKRFLG